MRLAHRIENVPARKNRVREGIPGGTHRYTGSTLFTDFINDILAWFPADTDGFSAIISNGAYETVISPAGTSGKVLTKSEIEAGIPINKVSVLSLVNGEAVVDFTFDYTTVNQIVVTPGKMIFYLKGERNTVGVFLRKGML